MKPFVLTEAKWRALEQRLKTDYPRSVLLSRSKMKRVLGFTTRAHREWQCHRKTDGYWQEAVLMVHLDFFDEQKQTLFLLKYSEYVNSNRHA